MKAGPRDLLGLRTSLEMIPFIQKLIEPVPALAALLKTLHACEEVTDHIIRAITDDPPAVLNTIGAIRAGYAKERRYSQRDVPDAANGLPISKRRTPPHRNYSIKVGFNKVFGYYIEVSHANVDKVPKITSASRPQLER